MYYFRKQLDNDDRDRCFIITGSMTAYIDSPVSFINTLPGIKTQQNNPWCVGQLGIYIYKAWFTWFHEDGSAKQLGARY